MHPVKHFEEEPGRRSAAKLLAKVEARRIANIAKLPQLLTRRSCDLRGLAIARSTNPCNRNVGRDSPEHSKAFDSNMSNMAHSEVGRSSPSSQCDRSSHKGSGFSCPVDILRWPDHIGPSQT